MQVAIRLVGQDQASGPINNVARSLTGLESSAGRSSSALSKIGGAIGGMAVAGAATGIAAVVAGFGAAVTAAAGFESKMSAVAAVSGATGEQFQALSQKALQIGKDTSFSASEAAGAIEELVKAGVSIDDVLSGAAEATTSLAAAGGVDLRAAAEVAANALNQFNLEGKDMAGVADLIAGAANASAIDVGDFRLSLSQVGGVANLVGLNFKDTATAIALMGQEGYKGSDAGTSLKTMLLSLQPATDKQKALFRELGIVTAEGANRFFDAEGKAKGLADISEVLQEALAGMTDQQKAATLEVLFGSDAIRAAAVLAGNGAEGFIEMADAMGKISAADVARTRLDNLAGSMEQLKGSLETAAIMVGQQFTPIFRGMVDGITAGVNAAMPAMQTFAITAASMFTSLQEAIGGADVRAQMAEVLANIFPPETANAIAEGINFVIGAVREFGAELERVGAIDDLRATWEIIANDIAPALRNALAGAGEDAFAMNESFRRGGEGVGILALAMKEVTGVVREVAGGIAQIMDLFNTLAGVLTGAQTGLNAYGRALNALARGNIADARAFMQESNDAFARVGDIVGDFYSRQVAAAQQGKAGTVAATQEQFASMDAAAQSGMSAVEAAVANGMEAQASAVQSGSSASEQALSAGMAAMESAAATGMAGVETAVTTGMTNAEAATTGGMASIEAAVSTGSANASAAAQAEFGAIPPAVAATMGQIPGGVEAAMSQVPGIVQAGVGQGVATVSAQEGAASSAGSGVGGAIADGLRSGIMARLGQVASAAAELVSSAVSAARQAAGVQSPSKLFAEVGRQIAEGMGLGIKEGSFKAADSIQGLVAALAKMAAEAERTLPDLSDWVRKLRDYEITAGTAARQGEKLAEMQRRLADARLWARPETLSFQQRFNELEAEELALKERMLPLVRNREAAERALRAARDEVARAEAQEDEAWIKRASTRADVARRQLEAAEKALEPYETEARLIREREEEFRLSQAAFDNQRRASELAQEQAITHEEQLKRVFETQQEGAEKAALGQEAVTDKVAGTTGALGDMQRGATDAGNAVGGIEDAGGALGRTFPGAIAPATKSVRDLANEAKDAAEELEGLQNFLNDLEERDTLSKSFGPRLEDFSEEEREAGIPNWPERHGGGRVRAGLPYIVGGPGAEELFVPQASGMILSHAATERALRVSQPFTLPSISAGLQAGAPMIDYDRLAAALARQPIMVQVDGRTIATVTRSEHLRTGRRNSRNAWGDLG